MITRALTFLTKIGLGYKERQLVEKCSDSSVKPVNFVSLISDPDGF